MPIPLNIFKPKWRDKSWGKMKSPWSRSLSENRYSLQALQNQLHFLGHWCKIWTWHWASHGRREVGWLCLYVNVRNSNQDLASTTTIQILELEYQVIPVLPRYFPDKLTEFHQGQMTCLRPSDSMYNPPQQLCQGTVMFLLPCGRTMWAQG